MQEEIHEADLLTERGIAFHVPARSLLRLLRKERRFVIRPPYLGTLDALTAEFLQMDYDQQALEQDFTSEFKRLAHRSARRCARIVAIAILNSYWGIKLLAAPLAWYLLWRITPRRLTELTVIIHKMMDMGNFTLSIRYLSIVRTTTPTLIEETESEG